MRPFNLKKAKSFLLSKVWSLPLRGAANSGYRLSGGTGLLKAGQQAKMPALQIAVVLIAVLVLSVVTVVAQDTASLTSPDVVRVGQRLACRCGGCRNTVGTCPMVRCGSADPLRQRIYNMKQAGASDDDVVNTIVREDGIVALASPPGQGLGLLTWVMPGVALLIGFFIYQRWVRRNQKDPEPITAVDQAVLDRFQSQIERELDEEVSQDGSKAKK